MIDIGRLLLRYKKITALFAVLAAIYLIQGLLAPIKPGTLEKYHITSLQLHELVLTIAIPYIVIWVIALVGYLRLREYTESLGNGKDGDGFRLITKGVFWFTLWLPLATLITAIGEAAYRNHVGLTPVTIRLETYANSIILAPAFIYVYEGSKKLASMIKNRPANPSLALTLAAITFAVLYTFMTLHDSARRIPPDSVTPASYYMSDWLIILTVVIPRLLLWYLGAQAVYNLLLYRRKVAGVIYKKALKLLASGLGSLVVTIIILRSLQSLNRPLSELNLVALLLVYYLLLLEMGVSYVFIAKGAKQLQGIEEA